MSYSREVEVCPWVDLVCRSCNFSSFYFSSWCYMSLSQRSSMFTVLRCSACPVVMWVCNRLCWRIIFEQWNYYCWQKKGSGLFDFWSCGDYPGFDYLKYLLHFFLRSFDTWMFVSKKSPEALENDGITKCHYTHFNPDSLHLLRQGGWYQYLPICFRLVSTQCWACFLPWYFEFSMRYRCCQLLIRACLELDLNSY